jgi:hypothetical protein
MKWLAIVTTLKLLFVYGEKIASLANSRFSVGKSWKIFGKSSSENLRRKILNLLMFDNILGNFGQNMTTPPPPPPPPPVLMVSRRPCAPKILQVFSESRYTM